MQNIIIYDLRLKDSLLLHENQNLKRIIIRRLFGDILLKKIIFCDLVLFISMILLVWHIQRFYKLARFIV